MKRLVVRGSLVGLMAIVAIAWTTTPAYAIKEFFAEFESRYVKHNSRKRVDVALAKAVDEAKCTICHPGDDKHKLTAYGTEIAKLVNKFDKEKKKKIQDALERAATMHSDSYNSKSPTFGTQLRQGKLPEGPE